jgi:hypothetical protein
MLPSLASFATPPRTKRKNPDPPSCESGWNLPVLCGFGLTHELGGPRTMRHGLFVRARKSPAEHPEGHESRFYSVIPPPDANRKRGLRVCPSRVCPSNLGGGPCGPPNPPGPPVCRPSVVPFLSRRSPELGAAFYPDRRGPLPFAFGRVKPEHSVLPETVREARPWGIRR